MNLQQIKDASKKYDDEHKANHKSDLTSRFKSLVDNHGVSAVAAAMGLNEASVLTYCRSKIVPVNEYKVVKAEKILNQE